MIHVAVIGLGYWGPNLVRNFANLGGGELLVVCDQDPERAKAIGRSYPGLRVETDPQRVFGDPEIDAVALATPVSTHYALAKAALRAGKSVLVEKPLTDNAEHAQELIDLAQRLGLVLMVDHVYVHSPAVKMIKELVDTEALGELLYIDSVRINLGLFQRDVNVVWDLAPHDLSIVDHLLGRLPRSLAAFGAAHAGQDLEDVAYLNLDFGGGLIANFHLNWLSPVKIRYMMIGGRKKGLIYNDLHPAEAIKIYDSGITIREDNLENRRKLMIDYRTGDVWSPHVAGGEPLQFMVRHFVECVRERKRPLTDGEAGLRIVRILEAAQRSIKAQGGRITL